jgi:hypothetical protein
MAFLAYLSFDFLNSLASGACSLITLEELAEDGDSLRELGKVVR